MNGAIMIKQMLMAIVLMSLLVGNSLDAEASQRTIRQQQQQQQKIADIQQSESKVREKRFINPFSGLFSVWSALTHIYSLYAEQKNETYHAFEQTYDILADSFNDTYQSTIRPTTTTKSPSDKGPPSSTSAPFRIPRKELGYLLGRNYRGLKKLWNIEINDALNQSKYSIAQYQQEKAWALYPYTIKKFPPPKNSTSTSV